MILEYIWIDGKYGMRSKYRVWNSNDDSFNFPIWNYDGSSTDQTDTSNSEVILCPVASYPNPFLRDHELGKSYLVLCDTYIYNDFGLLVPSNTNNRYQSNIIFNRSNQDNPWFGLEQEYFMMKNTTCCSNSCPAFGSILKEQCQYYCGVGSQNILHRQLVEKHMDYCLYAGLSISGANAEVAPNQWEFQIGPVEGISAGDQLYTARYILCKLAEEYNVTISFNPKPLRNPWNGSGLHTNFSTNNTRNQHNGLSIINSYIEKLSHNHDKHLLIYGDNSKRLNTAGMVESDIVVEKRNRKKKVIYDV